MEQIVMISSGAAVLGNQGWGGYAISKAALSMLARLYAHEFTQTHISLVPSRLTVFFLTLVKIGEIDLTN
ncbi:MAG: SDR family NAD(P)-dependent oxidoreductase [Gammaproteobacteria bacterium]|nr:SDR family NAD(P)-dependent oxidoreductase [Gammaproteobacteria bacterium]